MIRSSDDPSLIARTWRRTIYVGGRFWKLPGSQIRAVIAHEEAHAKGYHTEWRIACLLLAFPLLPLLCWLQEFSADRHAVRRGHGDGMLRFLAEDRPASLTHPSNAARRKRIKLALLTLRAKPSPGTT